MAQVPYTRAVPPLRELSAPAITPAARLLALAMRDNPTHVAVFGAAAERRERLLLQFFLAVLPFIARQGTLVGLHEEDTLRGVIGMVPPGACRPAVLAALRLAPGLLRGHTPAGAVRLLRWLGIWRSLDPPVSHWHIGPFAVHPQRRRRGLGSRLLQACCERVDASGAAAYLETDLERNVHFYHRHGFEPVEQRTVLGVPNWFLLRPSESRRSSRAPCA